jgi:hypothetical protein
VAIPPPQPGLVFRYEYAWKRDALAGRDTAKERPGCIVLTVVREAGDTRVLIVPITHAPPGPDVPAIELPPKLKAHLGLDGARSWVILSEANIDMWPTPDMRPIPGGGFKYGLLPSKMVNQIRETILLAVREKRLPLVDRENAGSTAAAQMK